MRKMLINGAWSEAAHGESRSIENPATREPLGMVSDGGRADVRRAVAAAMAAQPSWHDVPAPTKGELLKEIGSRIRAMAGQLAPLLTGESGSPICESRDYVGWAAAYFEGVGADLCADSDRTVSLATAIQIARTGASAGGVIAAVGTYHYPLPLMASSVAPALAAGNAVICKPPDGNVLVNLKLAEVYEVLPPGVVNVICGGLEVERALIDEPDIDLVMFAGSNAAGLELTRTAGAAFGRIHLQQCASEPAIVLADADLEIAVPGVAWQSLRRCGQDCRAVKRIYVQDSMAADFADRIHEYVAFLEVGDPIKPDTDLGPLISFDAARRVEAQVAHAAKDGARLKLGGRCFQPWGLSGHFFQPTILTNVRHGSAAARAQILGPVLLIIPVASAREAIRFAYGEGDRFAARVYTRDPARIRHELQSLGGTAHWIEDDARETDAAARTVALGSRVPAQLQFEHIVTRKPWWFPYRNRKLAPGSHSC